MTRYSQLISIINETKPRTLFEFGTWNGDRAIEMVNAAKKHRKDVQYGGLDLFELGTPDLDAAESNVKPHIPIQEVFDKIKAATGLNEKDCQLLRANSRDVKGEIATQHGPPDLVFIDGGHSIETIRHDFSLVKNAKLVVFDDYYVPDENGQCLDITQYGCNALVKEIGAALLPEKDPVFVAGKRCGYVQMAIWPPPQQEIRVKTKNVGSDREIQDNIKFALGMYHPRKISPMRAHSGQALLCAGGPSLEKELPALVRLAREGGTIFAVKSAHDRLLNLGVVPDCCILLDPRGHVKDFIENPHPDVDYIVASMCHRSVFQRLQQHDARVWLYHARVGAGEEQVLASVIKDGAELMIAGGCSSATRGLSLAHLLGFRSAHLFGYDLCYDGPGEGRVQITVRDGKVFMKGDIWTDFEKVAQAQELAMAIRDGTVEIEVHGGTVAALIREQIPRAQDFHRVFGRSRSRAA